MDEGVNYFANLPTSDNSKPNSSFVAVGVFLAILIVLTTVLAISITSSKLQKLLKTTENSVYEPFTEKNMKNMNIMNELSGDEFAKDMPSIGKKTFYWDHHLFIAVYETKWDDGPVKARLVNVIHSPDCKCMTKMHNMADVLYELTTDYDN